MQALDRYAYVNNSPVVWVDPTGHSINCAIGEHGCRAGKLPPSSLIDLYSSFYDLDNKVNPSCSHAWERLMYDIDNYLRSLPKGSQYSPTSDYRLDGYSHFQYERIRMEYWLIRANGNFGEAYNLRAFYDYGITFDEVHWDGSKVNWWITGADLVGLAGSFIALGAPAKSLARALAVPISRAAGGISAGLSATEGDYGSAVVTVGGFTPPPFGPTYSFIAVMLDLNKGSYSSPYVPSVPR